MFIALIKGLISSIAAPVVPIQLAKKVPIKIIARFTIGVPTRAPVSLTPPDIVNKAKRRMINGTYSNKPTCNNSYKVTPIPSLMTNGMINIEAQKRRYFTKVMMPKIR